MPTKTTRPNTPAEQDAAYNPGNLHAAEQFPEAYQTHVIDQMESSLADNSPAGTGKSGDLSGGRANPSANVEGVKEQEGASGGWQNNYSGQSASGGGKSPISMKGILKKRGPMAIIIALVTAGGGFFAMFTPGALLVNLKETMLNKFNDQLAAMDERTTMIIKKKIKGTTGGICTNIATLRCRYNSMGNRQIKRLEAAGVKINKTNSGVPGRSRVTSIEFEGRTISADAFANELRANPTFRAAMMRGYSPKLAGYADSRFMKLATRLGINKQANIHGDTDEERRQSIADAASGAAAAEAGSGVKSILEDCDDGDDCVDGKRKVYIDEATGERLSRSQYDERIQAAAEERVGVTKDTVDCDGGDGCVDGKRTTYTDPTGKTISEAEYKERLRAQAGIIEELDARRALAQTGEAAVKGTLKGALTSTALGLGAVDSACTGYILIRTVGAAAQYLGALQLLRYAQVFMNTPDVLRAGDATPEMVETAGKTLTSTNILGQSATDSYGYKYAAFGDTGGMPRNEDVASESVDGNNNNIQLGDAEKQKIEVSNETTKYINGQLVSDNLLTKVISFTKKSGTTAQIDDACGFIKSGWGQAIVIGGALVGAVAAFFSGGASLTWGVGLQVAVSVAISVAIALLTPKLVDMAAGNMITGKENGNQAGNAITSGMGAYNHQTASARGIPVLNKDSVSLVAYAQQQQDVRAQYAAVDRVEHSPLDISNPNTFMGTIFSRMAPYATSINSVSSGMASMVQFSMGSFLNLLPSANAADPTAEFKVCEDRDYNDIGAATDPFCNNKHYLDAHTDPEVVLDYMENHGYVEKDTVDGAPKESDNEYAEYLKSCTERSVAIGGYTEDNPQDKGEQCIQGSALNDPRQEPSRDANCTSGDSGQNEECKRNMFRQFWIDVGGDDGMEKGYATNGGGANTNNSGQADSAAPAECQSMPEGDLGQIACKAYQFDNYGYKWGGGHAGTAKKFMEDFKAGKYDAGKDAILDCSGLVRMAIFEATGTDIGGMGTGGYTSYSKFKEVSKADAKAGDILWTSAHTEIVVSNDTAAKKWQIIGAHNSNVAFKDQVGPTSAAYGKYDKVFRFQK